MACLISSITTFSRFSFDKELVAMQAAGLSLLRIAVPVFVFSFLVFLGTLFLSQWGQPWSAISLKKLAISLIQDQLHLALDRGVFNEPADDLMIFRSQARARRENQGYFHPGSAGPGQKKSLSRLKPSKCSKIRNASNSAFDYMKGRFTIFPRTAPNIIWWRFPRMISKWLRLPLSTSKNPNGRIINTIMAELEKSDWRDTGMLRRLMEYYKDLGFPVATLILGVLGMPVGIVSKRTGRMRGFVLGIFIMVGYYLLNVLGEFSVTALFLHPFVGAWLPNVLLLLMTWMLFYQASRR